jgi:hypothetical protein
MSVCAHSRGWLSTLYRARFAPEEDLTAQESGSTFFRFFRSKHVADLRLIVALALAMLALHAFVVCIFAAEDVYDQTISSKSPAVAVSRPDPNTPSSLSITVASEPRPKAVTPAGKALEFFEFFFKVFRSGAPNIWRHNRLGLFNRLIKAWHR